jgi:hypothetical protein
LNESKSTAADATLGLEQKQLFHFRNLKFPLLPLGTHLECKSRFSHAVAQR